MSSLPDHSSESLRTENAQLLRDLESARKDIADGELRLKLISQAIVSVVIDWDLTTNQFTRLNSAEEVMGYEPDELARSYDEYRSGVHPDDLPRFDRTIEEWLKGQDEELHLDVRCQHKDGTYRNLHGHGVVVRETGTGRPLRIVASYRDVTTERNAHHALLQSEQRYRLAMDAIQGIVFDWDTVANTVYRSSGVTRLLGYAMSDIVPVPEWWQALIHPEDKDKTVKHVTQFIEHGQEYGSTGYRIRHRDGHYLHVFANFLAIRNERGRAERVVGCIVDLTPRIQAEEAQRQAERNYDQLFHDISLGLVVISPDQKVIECNQAFADMQKTNVKELIGTHIECMAVMTEWSKLQEPATREKMSDGEYPCEMNLLRKDGSPFPVHLRCKLISYQNYPQPCLFAIVEDLTERQRADQEKRHLEQHLQETQKLESLGVLAGGIAHDFNNLLTVILGNLSLIRQDIATTNPHYHSIEQAEQASVQAAELCRQMLAYAGRGQLDNRPFNLTDLIESSRALLNSVAGKHHHLHFHLSSGLPCMAGDPSQVRQVLLNLVQNAAEAIPTPGGTIDVLTGVGVLDDASLKRCVFQNQHHPGEYLWLEVRDSGQGMDHATRHRIFEPFFTTKFTGRGLGLAAVAGIVRNHRGLIQYHSEPKLGTFFRIYFHIDSSASAAIRPSLSAGHVTKSVARNQGTILVVDDEPTVRMVLARLLAKRGYAVIEAENGNEALEMIARYDSALRLIILDLTMPQRDGLSTLQELRSKKNHTPVVVISGYYSSELIPQLDQLNAKFISKPFSAQGLLAVIDPILAGS